MDPLAQLKDIHLPPPVSLWPPAIGWWILAVIILLGLIVLGLYIGRYIRKNRYRRVAGKRLKDIFQQYQEDENSIIYAININKLLKQVSVNYYEKSRISRLNDRSWIEFLDSSGKSEAFSRGPGQVLATLPYLEPGQPLPEQFNAEALYRCSARWIRKHR